MVLEPAPVGVDDEQTIVAHKLGLKHLVVVHPCLPCPLAHSDLFTVAVIELQSVGELRKRGRMAILTGIPLNGSPHRHAVRLLWSERLAIFRAGLASLSPVSPGKSADCPVSGAVRKKRSLKNKLRTVLYVLGLHANNPSVRRVCLHGNRMIWGKEPHILLRVNKLQLLVVLIIGCRAGVASLRVPELADHPSKALVWTDLHASAKMHADLRAIVATEHRAVVNQGHFQPVSRGSHGSTHSGDAASHNDKVKLLPSRCHRP